MGICLTSLLFLYTQVCTDNTITKRVLIDCANMNMNERERESAGEKNASMATENVERAEQERAGMEEKEWI